MEAVGDSSRDGHPPINYVNKEFIKTTIQNTIGAGSDVEAEMISQIQDAHGIISGDSTPQHEEWRDRIIDEYIEFVTSLIHAEIGIND